MIETKSIIEKVNAQFNKMWNEILEKGWKYILETYHPDTILIIKKPKKFLISIEKYILQLKRDLELPSLN